MTAAYGHWSSPITTDDVAATSTSYDELRAGNGQLFWIEGHSGWSTLMRWTGSDEQNPTPLAEAVGSSVYEYGGGSYDLGHDAVWFTGTDRHIYRVAVRPTVGQPQRITTSIIEGWQVRYGDLRLSPDELWLACVRETHRPSGSVITDLVVVSTPGGHAICLSRSADFYSSPTWHPHGDRLAWVSWNDPDMPWDATYLWVAGFHAGRLTEKICIAGGPNESVLQPRWHGEDLYFVSDRSGWWNLYRWSRGKISVVLAAASELTAAPWELGYSTYDFLPDGRIIVLCQNGGRTRLRLHDPVTGRGQDIALPYHSIKPYLAADGQRIGIIGSSPTSSPTVATFTISRDLLAGHLTEIAGPPQVIPEGYLSTPQPFEATMRDAQTIHGLYYPPANPQVTPPPQPPPLIMRVHPGPTAHVPHRLDIHVQFFTSRGFAVADVDYRGSTGYGRAYRRALNGHWGELDVTDCIDAARALVHQGHADPEVMFITGSSAGGYTVIRALTHNVFRAGAARSAVFDPGAWAAAAPRFQRHHAQRLAAGAPTPVGHPTRPLLLFHGERDTVVPASLAHEFATNHAQASDDRRLCLLPGEGHYLTSLTATREILTQELAHYRRHLHRSSLT